jgi:hypothetical protein
MRWRFRARLVGERAAYVKRGRDIAQDQKYEQRADVVQLAGSTQQQGDDDRDGGDQAVVEGDHVRPFGRRRLNRQAVNPRLDHALLGNRQRQEQEGVPERQRRMITP